MSLRPPVDAVVAIQGGYEPYGSEIEAPAGASVNCAVVEAAYPTLHFYFSSKPPLITTLDGYYADALSPLNLNGQRRRAEDRVGDLAPPSVPVTRA